VTVLTDTNTIEYLNDLSYCHIYWLILTLHIKSINQSKFIFQIITENYNVINAIALERLPEKHYAH